MDVIVHGVISTLEGAIQKANTGSHNAMYLSWILNSIAQGIVLGIVATFDHR